MPPAYRASPEIAGRVKLLSGYLEREEHGQSTLNRATVLWASSKLPGLLQPRQNAAIIQDILRSQQDDGGWSSTPLTAAQWKRKDSTPLETRSDGYATGLMALALERGGVPGADAKLAKALAWLVRNQDPASGFWPAWSLNQKRDPASDIGRFMANAATAYAVLALTDAR